MVSPDIALTMSPGLVARPLGMFSTAAARTTRLIGSLSSIVACRAASTEPAPLMSNFISSIARPGFSEIPPVSKVTPLPTRATGGESSGPPR